MVVFPYANPIYQPAIRIISAITNSNPAIVTTTINHLYVTGTIVRLELPIIAGMQQANQLFGPISVLSPTTFAIDIDTTNFDPFVAPIAAPPPAYQQPIATPIGEINEILTAAVQNVLPYP